MITKTVAGESEGSRLLEIDNGHFPSCGPPPELTAAGKYLGYFENPYGEQWVFIGDRESGEAVIRGGDCGWEREYALSVENPCPRLVLNEPEKEWIVACLMGMSYKPYDEIVANWSRAAKRVAAELTKEMKEQAKRKR